VAPRVIAIDGPAASGKSSTGARVAERLGWAHLDSGALYRAITLAEIDNIGEGGRGEGEGWNAQRIVALARDLPVGLALVGWEFTPSVAGVDVEEAVRSERVTGHVSAVAALPEVRAWVNAEQRRAVQQHPAGVVVDGRDIGTVVFPDAPLKIFLDATARSARGGASPSGVKRPTPTACAARARPSPPGTTRTASVRWPRSSPPPTLYCWTPRMCRWTSKLRVWWR